LSKISAFGGAVKEFEQEITEDAETRDRFFEKKGTKVTKEIWAGPAGLGGGCGRQGAIFGFWESFNNALMAQAKSNGWKVTSMKSNWRRVFAVEP
jgi:hypothetical protein